MLTRWNDENADILIKNKNWLPWVLNVLMSTHGEQADPRGQMLSDMAIKLASGLLGHAMKNGNMIQVF